MAALDAYRAVTEKKPPNTRIGEAFARHLAFWGDREKAESVLKEAGADATPLGKQFLAELKAGKTPKLMVSTVEEGLAESFLGIGQVLATNNGVDAAQIYLRLALFLNPASDIAKLELAELYGNLEQYEKAIAVIDTVRDNSPFWINARVRKALYLNALQKSDEAVALLTGVAGEESERGDASADARFHRKRSQEIRSSHSLLRPRHRLDRNAGKEALGPLLCAWDCL